MKYFAYGSNLNHKQMVERCPDSKFLKRAYLDNYRLVYDGYSKRWDGAPANIVESRGDMVWGGVYSISEKDLERLDKCENCNNSKSKEGICSQCGEDLYARKEMVFFDDNGREVRALVYFRTGREESEPSAKYLETVLCGAHDCGLPKNYINALNTGIIKV